MAKYKVLAIRDRAVDGYMRPMFVPSVGAAVRLFTDALNDNSKESAIAQHPEDYDLYELGEFDDGSGMFTTGVPRQVAVGKDLVRSKQ